MEFYDLLSTFLFETSIYSWFYFNTIFILRIFIIVILKSLNFLLLKLEPFTFHSFFKHPLRFIFYSFPNFLSGIKKAFPRNNFLLATFLVKMYLFIEYLKLLKQSRKIFLNWILKPDISRFNSKMIEHLFFLVAQKQFWRLWQMRLIWNLEISDIILYHSLLSKATYLPVNQRVYLKWSSFIGQWSRWSRPFRKHIVLSVLRPSESIIFLDM